jgi:hypothetical protein
VVKQVLPIVLLGVTSGLCIAATPAKALTYVGSWEVGQPGAPSWPQNPPNGPLAYTGQEAAALLFGGTASDYRISTVSSAITDLNDSAWYSTWGETGGRIFADDYVNKYLGLYYGPPSGGTGTASAYVIDNCGPQFVPGACGTNYAFRLDPEPVPGPLPFLGIGAAFGLSRRLKLKQRTNYGKLPAAGSFMPIDGQHA